MNRKPLRIQESLLVVLRDTLQRLASAQPLKSTLPCRPSSSASFVSASPISKHNPPRCAVFSTSRVIESPKLEDDERSLTLTNHIYVLRHGARSTLRQDEMVTDVVFRKLFEIERAIGIRDSSTIRMMVIDAQDRVLQMEWDLKRSLHRLR